MVRGLVFFFGCLNWVGGEGQCSGRLRTTTRKLGDGPVNLAGARSAQSVPASSRPPRAPLTGPPPRAPRKQQNKATERRVKTSKLSCRLTALFSVFKTLPLVERCLGKVYASQGL